MTTYAVLNSPVTKPRAPTSAECAALREHGVSCSPACKIMLDGELYRPERGTRNYHYTDARLVAV